MQSSFGAGFLWGTPAGGAPVPFAALQSVSMDVSFDQKLLYGQSSFALEQARGKGKIDFKATVGRIDPTLFNAIFWGGAASSGQVLVALGEPAVIGAAPQVETPAASGPPATPATFDYELANRAAGVRVIFGVYNLTTQRFMTAVTGAPLIAPGAYYPYAPTGDVIFDAADAGQAVKIYYSYAGAGGTTVTVSNPLMDSGPVFRADLVQTFRGKQTVLTAWACQAFKLSLPLKQDDFTLPEFDFSAMDDGTGSVLTQSMNGY